MISCEAVGGKSNAIIPVACSMEILHKASLIHDDLIDEDNLRRGHETFHKRFGSKKAVIMGDLMVSIAFENIIRHRQKIKDPIQQKRYDACLYSIISTFRRLATGELAEEVLKTKTEVCETEIEEIIYNKTAVLIEQCFRAGAILGNGSKSEVNMLSCFGKNVGLAFQTINDINNIDGMEKKIKKTFATDLFQKKKNLTPVSYTHLTLPTN